MQNKFIHQSKYLFLSILFILIIPPFSKAASRTKKTTASPGHTPSAFLSRVKTTESQKISIAFRTPEARPTHLSTLIQEAFNGNLIVVYGPPSHGMARPQVDETVCSAYTITRHETQKTLMKEAQTYGLKECFFSAIKWNRKDEKDEKDGEDLEDIVSEKNWDYLADYDDLIQGLPLESPERVLDFKKWLMEAISLRHQHDGHYDCREQAYIDLSLQYMTLQHTEMVLLDNTLYFQEFENNPLAQLQVAMCHQPEQTLRQLSQTLFFMKRGQLEDHMQWVIMKFGKQQVKERLNTGFSGFRNFQPQELMPIQTVPDTAEPFSQNTICR